MQVNKANILILFLLTYFSVKSQTFIDGRIYDSKTKDPISYANVYIKGTTVGATTNDSGYYQLNLTHQYDSISAMFLGYLETTLPIKKTAKQQINFYLNESQSMLAEAVIVARRESLEDYLIRKILENKDKNDKRHLQNYSYELYNKIELDVKNLSEKFLNRKIFKPFKFVFNNIDSTSGSEPFLPMLLSENISDVYFTTKMNKTREVVKASKMSGVNDASFNEFLNFTYQDINIYDNAYTIIGKQFISPIANACKTFYKYKVTDTLVMDNIVHYKMEFEPKTKGDNTFYGSLVVSENNYAIKNIQLKMAPHVNINFVKNIDIKQEFDLVGNQTWMMTSDYLMIEFKPLEKTPAIVTKKNTVYRNFLLNSSYNDSVINKLKEELTIEEDKVKKDQAFWDSSRFVPLSKNEAAVYHIIDTLKTVPAYKSYMDIINMLLTGYYPIGPVGLGPILSAVSVNKLEGWRFGLGIKTNEKMCKWAQVSGHIAYGLKDHRLKGDVGVKFLIYKLPRQTIGASYEHEVSKLRRTTDLLATDNLLNVIIQRRKPTFRLLYYDAAKINYNIEYKPGLSVGITLQNIKIEQGLVPFKYLYLNKESVLDTFKTLRQSEVILNARFAIGERYVNKNSLFRRSINTFNIPVIQFEYVVGFKKFLGSQFNYHKLMLSYAQTVPIRTIGRLEIKLQAGKIFGKVPFLLSEIHDGNQTYTFSNSAFNVMNDYEFYSDQYLQWNFTHHFDGFFLNRIPGIRKLKLREVIHTRGVWGNVSQQNRAFNQQNDSFIKPLGKIPYVEVGFGLENILKFIRWDVMWRVTHRDNPKAYKWMMTFGFNFNF